MVFQFSLAVLLRFRKSIERQQEARLEHANQQATGLRRQIEDIERAVAEATANDAQELASGLRAAELHFSQVRREVLAERRAQREKELAVAIEIQSQRRLAFQTARQQREVVTSLRKRQLEGFREREARQEQRRLDDLFLLRRQYLRREFRRPE